ncbi:MAG: SPFH domain-containing protein [Phycisphaerae bacterium]|jgi:regulator of protease activity HflC (stomatin/prohibitin superfamily)
MKLTRVITIVVGAGLILVAVGMGFVWGVCRVYVGPDECLVLIRKNGAPLPAGQLIAEPGQRGIQREALGPGRYFLNPWKWDTEVVPAIEISAGDPATWREVWAAGEADYGVPRMDGKWPEVGLVTSLAGQPWTKESEVVDEGFQGIQRKVLTPGTYRLNPRAYKVDRVPATLVPLGCIGVVTSRLGDMPGTETISEVSIGPDGEPQERPRVVQKLAEEGQRGVLRNVLQPGIYYLNPKVYKVDIVQIGFNQLSQFRSEDLGTNISFPSEDGFTIGVEVTVVWGRHPAHTPEMISRMGDVAKIRQIILGQIRSICRNIGSKYKSTDFIQGEKREQYQQSVTQTLQRVCRERDIEVLIALIQNIEVSGGTAPGGAGLDLKQTIQRGYIAAEEDLTKQAQRETAKVRADLETAQVDIEVARERITADTRKKVAELKAEGQKKAEEIDAQRDLEVAQIERQIAELEAETTRVLGKAEADVERLAHQADADGQRMMIGAFGSGRAFNLYTFAQNFAPESIRLIFAGEGTFWTDLNRLQDAAGLELLRNSAAPPAPAPAP